MWVYSPYILIDVRAKPYVYHSPNIHPHQHTLWLIHPVLRCTLNHVIFNAMESASLVSMIFQVT